MLHKFKRHKPRKGFAVDRIFKGLSTNKFSKNGRHLFTTHKYLSPYYNDDRFCNILIQWNEQIQSKLSSAKAKRLFPFYPSYIPIINHRTVVSKADFYNISTSIDYDCINCGSEIRSVWGERSIKNFLCSKCVDEHFIDAGGNFNYMSNMKELYSEKFSRNILDFFTLEQDREKKIFRKILKKSEDYNKRLVDYKNTRKISGFYTRLRNSLPIQ